MNNRSDPLTDRFVTLCLVINIFNADKRYIFHVAAANAIVVAVIHNTTELKIHGNLMKIILIVMIALVVIAGDEVFQVFGFNRISLTLLLLDCIWPCFTFLSNKSCPIDYED
uniref:Uncharacterized protein n=1 Tax=Glossina brevipalpis TaxID=37001 RepID=A0A1A9WUU1_9MUSC